MAPKVQGALRKELAAKAFDLHIKRDTNVEIAAKLDISRKLVPTLIREELPVSEKSSSRKLDCQCWGGAEAQKEKRVHRASY